MGNNIYFNRLKEFWESMNLEDANCFAKSLGWDRTEKILRLDRPNHEDEKPGISVLLDIANVYPDFDFNFLLTGKKKSIEYLIPEVKPDIANDGNDCCKLCKEKDERIMELKDHIASLKRELDAKKEAPSSDSPQFGEGAKQYKAG